MKKHLLILAMMLLPLYALADAVEIDGIYYNLIEKGKVAEVTVNPNINKYSGDVVIPEKVTYNDVEYSVGLIGNDAFLGCYSLTSITIPNSVTSIGSATFWNCSRLTSITIPNSVISIGNGAFYGCKNLTSVYITDLTAWCAITFQSNDSNPLAYAHHLYIDGQEVKELNIPNSVTSIRQYAFYGCFDLTSITIPNSVTSIGTGAFGTCSGLTSINIPNSVTSIGESAFTYCTGLTSITIPNSVTSIGSSMFYGCSGLTSITIPNSVTSIGYSTFYDCKSLTSITIPNSVTNIGQLAFSGCKSLTSITIPNSVTKIWDWAFSDCSGLTFITIPNSVTSIGQYAFSGCSKLENVYCHAEKVPSTKTDAFKDSYPQYATLHVPASALNDYKTTAPWSEFGTFKTIDGGDTPSTPKCAKPTISYDNFKLTYNCETEGVEYISEIKDADVKKYYDNSVSLGATYEISVYAIKSGYDNSDVATATLVFTNATFTTEGTSSAKSMNMNPLLIQANDGFITVDGMTEGQRMAIYLSDGKQVATVTSSNGKASVATNIQKGHTFIVKVGEKAVKVVMK